MPSDEIQVKDNIKTDLEADQPTPARESYVVTAEDGIFKRGKLYKKGETIELDAATAAGFMALEEVEAK